MKPKGNSIEKRIEITIQSIERNKDRKQRREKAEAKLEKLLQLKEELERKQAEKEEWRSESKKRKKEYMHWYWRNVRKKDLYTRNEDLYTKEELMNPPEGEVGRINWLKWNEVVEECRRMFR